MKIERTSIIISKNDSKKLNKFKLLLAKRDNLKIIKKTWKRKEEIKNE